jgi:hypothetical protein
MNYKDNNKVNIVGLLSENNVEQREKDGRKYVTGNIKIRVGDNDIPVNVFAFDKTKAGTINPAYTQIMNVCDKGVSLAACGGDITKATKIRAGSCRFEENIFASRFNGNIVSTVRITGSFFTLGASEEPKANFSCGICIKSIKDEIDSEGDETGRLLIEGILEQYNRWDIITFIAESQQAVDYIKNNWEVKDCVSVSGKIVGKTITNTISKESEGGFGEPEEETRTYHRIEYIITSGSEPKEEEYGYKAEDVKNGLADRERRKAELTEGAKQPAAKAVANDDFGF